MKGYIEFNKMKPYTIKLQEKKGTIMFNINMEVKGCINIMNWHLQDIKRHLQAYKYIQNLVTQRWNL